MAIYHLSVKAISRSSGRTATAAAAYRAGSLGERIMDQRTGETYDYTRKKGVQSVDIVLQSGAAKWARNRAHLWNAAELAEKRKDACVAREFEVALPAELSPAERRRLALDFAQDMADREGCAVDVAIHAPGREGDHRNHHAHILRTTRKVGPEGLGDKLDTEKAGRNRREDLEAVRARWAALANERLRENGIEATIDHRSLEVQGIDRAPTSHLGPAVTAMERRGQRTEVSRRLQAEATERLAKAKIEGELAREAEQVNASIIDTATDLRQLLAARAEAAHQGERDRQQAEARAYAQHATEQFKRELAARASARKAADQQREQLAQQAFDQVRTSKPIDKEPGRQIGGDIEWDSPQPGRDDKGWSHDL